MKNCVGTTLIPNSLSHASFDRNVCGLPLSNRKCATYEQHDSVRRLIANGNIVRLFRPKIIPSTMAGEFIAVKFIGASDRYGKPSSVEISFRKTSSSTSLIKRSYRFGISLGLTSMTRGIILGEDMFAKGKRKVRERRGRGRWVRK